MAHVCTITNANALYNMMPFLAGVYYLLVGGIELVNQ